MMSDDYGDFLWCRFQLGCSWRILYGVVEVSLQTQMIGKKHFQSNKLKELSPDALVYLYDFDERVALKGLCKHSNTQCQALCQRAGSI